MAPRKRKKVEFGPSVRVQFMNLENPGSEKEPSPELRFNFEGRNFGPFVSGNYYDVPELVVEHLNNLSTPVYQFRNDPVTNQPVSTVTGKRNRFLCIVQPRIAETSLKTDGGEKL